MRKVISYTLVVTLICFNAALAWADDVDIGLRIGKDSGGWFSFDQGSGHQTWMFAAIAAAGLAIGAGLYFGLRDRRTHHPQT